MSKNGVSVILIGNSSVGKTSIIMRIGGKGFSDSNLATVGIDYLNKKYVSEKRN